jgi:hypothetical protein
VAIAAACIVLIASAVAYLHPLPPWTRSAPQASPAASMARARTTPILASISFGDADHGAVTLLPPTERNASSESTWLTANGGRTWQSFTALGSAPGAVVFDSPRHAVAEPFAPGSSMVTDDAGRTWRPLPLPGQGRLVFLDAGHAWLLQPLGEGATGPPPVALWRTSDGGASWQHLSDLGAPDAVLKGPPLFVDPQHGLLVVGTPRGGVASVLATVDGGVSWQPVATFGSPVPGAYLLSTQVFAHRGHLLVVPLWVTGAEVEPGSAGFRLGPDTAFHPSASVSDDAGRTWSPLRAGPSVGGAFNGVVSLTLDDHGRLVMFDRGRLWVSEDSGTTWRARPAALPRGMETAGTIIAAPGALFVAARADRLAPTNELLRSRDGGSHWSVVPLPKLAA